MNDLTEQWKEGELDIGEVYYVKTERGVYKANGEYLNSASCIYGFDISYIIAPVPTYSEYIAVAKQLEIAVKRIEFLKKKTASPYYGNNVYLKTIHQMCDKTLRQIEELDK